jgi:hypothetical protein
MPSGFKINKSGINSMMKEIQREFDKHPINVPVKAENPSLRIAGDTYNGPVIQIQGDNAQVAWGNRDVNQSNAISPLADITAGFEPLSQAVVLILKEISASGLDADDIAEVEKTGTDILDEVIKDQPDKGLIKRSVTYMKGLLAPLVTRVAEAAADGAGEGVHDWASAAVESLGAGMSVAFQG